MATNGKEPDAALRQPAKCPNCGEPAVFETRPFCSRRCRDVDLARWVSGSYVIAGGNADADEDGEDQTREAGGEGP